MCGRSACSRSAQSLQTSVNASQFHDQQRYRPSYNVGPSRFQPVLIRDSESGQRVLRAMKWGLIPFWTKKEPEFGDMIKAMNARDDSLLMNKPMFNHCKKSRRCVVIADGFFEWLKDSTPRQPYFVQFQGGKVLTMAGLYDVWKNPEGEDVYSYTVITTEPCSALTFLHDRMPLLLDNDEEIDQWLNTEIPFEDVKKLLRPYKGKLDIFPVSTFVNKMGHDSEECVKPITKKMEAQKITSWFKKAPETEKKEKKEGEDEGEVAAATKKEAAGPEAEVAPAAGKKREAAEAEADVKGAEAQKPEPKRIKLSEIKPQQPEPGKEKNPGGQARLDKDEDEEAEAEVEEEEETEESKAESIAALGFSIKAAKEALVKFAGDVNKACDWLMSSEDDPMI